jgi:two-component system, NarL family, response regulator NreC
MLERLGPLSQRETEVLRLLVLGFTNREVAETLHISVRTAESHRTSIQRKLAVSRRSELVRFALAHGMLLGDDGSGPDLMHPDGHE